MKHDVSTLVRHIFKGNIPLKQLLSINERKLEKLYSIGYQYHQSGFYSKALPYFRLLLLVDPKNPKYALALAMSLHLQKEYKRAALAYIVCAMNDPDNPLPWFHLSDCYIHLHEPDAAYQALQTLQELKGSSEVKEQAKLLAEQLHAFGVLEEGESHG